MSTKCGIVTFFSPDTFRLDFPPSAEGIRYLSAAPAMPSQVSTAPASVNAPAAVLSSATAIAPTSDPAAAPATARATAPAAAIAHAAGPRVPLCRLWMKVIVRGQMSNSQR